MHADSSFSQNNINMSQFYIPRTVPRAKSAKQVSCIRLIAVVGINEVDHVMSNLIQQKDQHYCISTGQKVPLWVHKDQTNINKTIIHNWSASASDHNWRCLSRRLNSLHWFIPFLRAWKSHGMQLRVCLSYGLWELYRYMIYNIYMDNCLFKQVVSSFGKLSHSNQFYHRF